MKLFRPAGSKDRSGATRAPAPDATQATTSEPHEGPHHGGQKKGRPTPSRKEAEAARRERLNPNLTPKEARKRAAEHNREQRMAAMAARDATPEKQLMRDVVDSRLNLGEFMLPALVLMLAITFFQQTGPWMWVFMALPYLYVLAVIIDLSVLWRRYKRLLGQRLPGTTTKGKGLMMYGFNRAIQMRRLRVPPPAVKRGDKL